ncbi:hypothetical protein L484_028010 [Morus notabilis]|uniref:Uncharacterized protein n=1 Tax=Morus notabilis TaxID=981085 RepID=W9S7X0_9ROSA|nr:hypothetical protein L484_028010 [Morus notabilis]
MVQSRMLHGSRRRDADLERTAGIVQSTWTDDGSSFTAPLRPVMLGAVSFWLSLRMIECGLAQSCLGPFAQSSKIR